MKKTIRISIVVVGLILIVVLAVGATVAFAQGGQEEPATESGPDQATPLFGHLLKRFWRDFGPHLGGRSPEGVTPRNELLAEALGITVEELTEAHAEAQDNWLDEMVEAGYLTQDQVDLMTALQALKGALDRQEIVAAALGVEVSELEEARLQGVPPGELLDRQGLSREEFKEALVAAVEDAVLASVPEVISQEQADLVLDWLFRLECRCRFRPHGRLPGHRLDSGWFRRPGPAGDASS